LEQSRIVNPRHRVSGVFFIEHQMPPYFALGIIENRIPKDSFKYDEKMKNISTNFRSKNNLKSFVVDYNVLT